MSITRVGGRSPNGRPAEAAGGEEHIGIPGLGRHALFYQDSHRLPTVSHGKGIYIYDTDGKRYLDACSGAISANLGHANERVMAAARRQMGRISFTYRTQFENEPANELAELLAQLSPREVNRVFFVNSGSEAVESAIKLARQYWWATGRRGKSEIFSRRPSYHGATLGALASTGFAPLITPFRAMLKPSLKISAPFCYHCPLGKRYPECGIDCAHELEREIQSVGAENIAAFLVEPIGGATTGAAVPPDEWFPIVERICNEYEILLIVDEVMTGCGRTGTFFGFEHWDITPDIVATSKGLSGGYTPIGAVLASSTIVDAVLQSGGFMHGHTYAGNPLSAAITLEVIRIILDEKLVENSRVVGTYLHQRLHELAERYPVIGDIRGRGLFSGIEFVRDRVNREPFPASWFVAFEATEIARKHGLLLYPRRSINGLSGDHVLIAPPLIIDEAGVDEIMVLFDRTLADLTAMVDKYLAEEARSAAIEPIERYQQSETVPAYARGDLSKIGPEEDANVTAAMRNDYASGDGEEFDPATEEEAGDDA